MINDILLDTEEDPTCPMCGYTIKKWGRAKCDVCEKSVCKHHRPMFDFSGDKPKYIAFWMCNDCKERLKKK